MQASCCIFTYYRGEIVYGCKSSESRRSEGIYNTAVVRLDFQPGDSFDVFLRSPFYKFCPDRGFSAFTDHIHKSSQSTSTAKSHIPLDQERLVQEMRTLQLLALSLLPLCQLSRAQALVSWFYPVKDPNTPTETWYLGETKELIWDTNEPEYNIYLQQNRALPATGYAIVFR